MRPDLDQDWAESVSNLPSGQEFISASNWVDDLYSGVTTGESLQDTSLRATEFINTVEQRLSIQESQLASDWTNEYEFEFNPQNANTWADEFVTSQNQKQEFWQGLQSEWDHLAEQDSQTHSWLQPSNSAVNQVLFEERIKLELS